MLRSPCYSRSLYQGGTNETKRTCNQTAASNPDCSGAGRGHVARGPAPAAVKRPGRVLRQTAVEPGAVAGSLSGGCGGLAAIAPVRARSSGRTPCPGSRAASVWREIGAGPGSGLTH